VALAGGRQGRPRALPVTTGVISGCRLAENRWEGRLQFNRPVPSSCRQLKTQRIGLRCRSLSGKPSTEDQHSRRNLLMAKTPLFREVQRFRQPWLWALLGSIALLMLVLGPISWGGLLAVGAVAALVYSLRLRTEVRADGVYLKMWPIHRSVRRIPWSDVERYEATQYSHSVSSVGGASAGRPERLRTTSAGIGGLDRTDERARRLSRRVTTSGGIRGSHRRGSRVASSRLYRWRATERGRKLDGSGTYLL